MQKLKIFLFSLLLQSAAFAQNYTISGYISDASSGETLISATVFEKNSYKGTVSNVYGFYSLTLPKGDVDINFSYVGLSMLNKKFKLNKDTLININLSQNLELDELTVTGSRGDIGVMGAQMSAIDVPISKLKTIPALFGETDVLKALQLLPGVQGGTEGSAGFYVRGGGPDENLFLLDGVPVYNVNHLGGFFSVFNADAIKSVTLYKGAFPARFGGRLSSVLDIRMNDGNNQKLKGNITIGAISSKINLEGPLFSKKTTFNISARRTYFDLLAQPLIALAARNEVDTKVRAGYYFYDVNAKISHTISDKDKLFLSLFSGDDVIYSNIRNGSGNFDNEKYESRLLMDWKWGNQIAALRWNRVLNNKLFMNTTATYTRYRFNMAVGNEDTFESINPPKKLFEKREVGYNSGIEDIAMKVDFDFAPNPNNDMKFGAHITNHKFKPGVSVLSAQMVDGNNTQENDTTFGDSRINANELAIYIEDNISIGTALKANFGLHYSGFLVEQQYYHSLQPRLSMRALLSNKLSVKAGYAMMSQYIHLLSNNNISLPTDLWVPVTKRIKPMDSHQFSAGVFYDVAKIAEFSVEGYYKNMNNLLEYQDGATFLGQSTAWEDKVYAGRGWAYGVELLAQRSFGKTTGWVGYTWSKTERLFDRPGQELNGARVFPAKYDRRHDLSIVVNHKFSEKFDFSATWVYSTGNAGTLALQNSIEYPVPGEYNNWYYTDHTGQKIYGPENSLPYISERNNFRLPDYHRLDLGFNFHKQLRKGMRTWSLGVYNTYNRFNPFLVYPSTKYSSNPISGMYESRPVLKQITIFPMIPSLSYSYKF